MESERIVSNIKIQIAIGKHGVTPYVNEGRLLLMELLSKANAGYRSSHTEELFLSEFNLLKADRTANKKGRQFLCSMIYTHSCGRPEAFELIQDYRI